MKKQTGLLVSTFVFINISTFVLAQSGSLDTTFNSNGSIPGTVETSFPNSTGSQASGIVIQSADLKIIVSGTANFSSDIKKFATARYNDDGSIDTTFGNSGIILTSIDGGDDQANAVVVQPVDGGIVVAGSAESQGVTQFALVRYNSNGTVDPTFGNNGIVTTSIGGTDDEIFSLAVQQDRKIVAAGFATISGAAQFVLARYKPNGTLDSSFGINGIVTTQINSSFDKIFSIAIQSDGKIIAAGYSTNASLQNVCALARYNTDGTLDATFGTNGIVTTQIGSINDQIYDIAIQSEDGKIVAAGASSYQPNLFEFIVMRYNIDGSLDTSFGVNGITQTKIGTANAMANSVGIKERGKILVAGFSGNNKATLARYNKNGALDTTFGNKGIATGITGAASEASSLALYADNQKVIIGGTIGTPSLDKPTFLAARYIS